MPGSKARYTIPMTLATKSYPNSSSVTNYKYSIQALINIVLSKTTHLENRMPNTSQDVKK